MDKKILSHFQKEFHTPIIEDELVFDQFIRRMSVEDIMKKWKMSSKVEADCLIASAIIGIAFESKLVQNALIQQIITNKHKYYEENKDEQS